MQKKKRPRIDPNIWKEYSKMAIDNDTSAELEIEKALKYYLDIKRKNANGRNKRE
jgi:hypothetical protein